MSDMDNSPGVPWVGIVLLLGILAIPMAVFVLDELDVELGEPIEIEGVVIDKYGSKYTPKDYYLVVVEDDGDVYRIRDALLYGEYEIGDRFLESIIKSRVEKQ